MSELYYAQRLANVSIKNPVIASIDIYNDQGGLVLAKGSQLLEKQAAIIAKHKLVKPLEQTIDITTSMDGEGLYSYLCRFMENIPGIRWILNTHNVLESIRELCLFYGKFPLLRQKLTVLAGSMPELYQSSLYCAVAGIAIASELKLTDSEKQAVFIGGLMHNVGFLHLSPEINWKRSELNNEFSTEIQAHPVIAQKFLDQIPKLPKHIGEAVRDHHERADGTGYTAQKRGKDISKASMVIATCDQIVEAFDRCTSHQEYLHDLIRCILQLNETVYSEEIYRATAVLFTKYQSSTQPPSEPPNLIEMLDQVARLNEAFGSLKKLSLILAQKVPNEFSLPLKYMVHRLDMSMSESGMNIPEYSHWIEGVMGSQDKSEYLGLLKSKFMQDEIALQLERLVFFNHKALPSVKEVNGELFHAGEQTLNRVEFLLGKVIE